jgi:hypothetical protein
MRYGKDRMTSKKIIPVINDVLSQYDERLTVRQIYYRLISDPYTLFENTSSNYNGFDKKLTIAREKGLVDWTRIEDRTRQSIGGEGHIINESIEDFIKGQLESLKDCWLYYDLQMWTSQQNFIEIWVEKDALSSVVARACQDYRILTFPSRGYSSFTEMKRTVDRLEENEDKEIYILHLADHDPSGLDMTRDLESRSSGYGGNSIKIKRIALNIDQVTKFKLKPNPVKTADTRSPDYMSQFGQECWELDALPPDELRKIITGEIKKYIDKEAWEARRQEIEDTQEEIKDRIDEIMENLDEE